MSEWKVDPAEAVSMLAVIEDYDDGNGPRPCVHTLVDGGFGVIGAHWGLDDVTALIEEQGVERSGEAAQAMGHGLVVLRPGKGPLFLETKPPSETP